MRYTENSYSGIFYIVFSSIFSLFLKDLFPITILMQTQFRKNGKWNIQVREKKNLVQLQQIKKLQRKAKRKGIPRK